MSDEVDDSAACPAPASPGEVPSNMCTQHDMEVMLYCKHPDCQVEICPLCLAQHHRGHTVVNIEEPRMTVLKSKAAAMKQRLSLDLSRLVATRQKIDRQWLDMIKNGNQRRNELVKEFDDKIRTVDDNIKKLNEISQRKTNDVEENNFRKDSKFIEQLQKQSEEVESKKYKFYKDLQETTQELEPPKEIADMRRMMRKEPTITVESSLTLGKSLDSVTGCLLLSDRSLLIYGSKRCYGDNKMLLRNWKKEELIYSKDMDIKGAIEIRKDDRQFLLVSDGTTTLKFLEVSNLAKCCECIDVGSKVAKLYLDPPDRVLFEAINTNFLQYAKIDAFSRAKPFALRLPEDRKDMCFIKDKDADDPSMRFFFACTEEVSAWNQDGRLLWSFSGAPTGMERDIKPTSITVSEKEQKLYVCDSANRCIQIISTDGVYQGSLVKYEEYGLGFHRLLRWCADTDSLLIVHWKDYTHHVCFLKVMKQK